MQRDFINENKCKNLGDSSKFNQSFLFSADYSRHFHIDSPGSRHVKSGCLRLMPKVLLIVLHTNLNAPSEVAGLRYGSEEVCLNQTQVIKL